MLEFTIGAIVGGLALKAAQEYQRERIARLSRIRRYRAVDLTPRPQEPVTNIEIVRTLNHTPFDERPFDDFEAQQQADEMPPPADMTEAEIIDLEQRLEHERSRI